MSTIAACRIAYEEMRELAFSSIDGTYTAVGTMSDNPTYMFCIDNTTDSDLRVSFDGITNNTFIAAGTGRVMDYSANKSVAGYAAQPQGTRVYVMTVDGGSPTEGAVYVTCIYLATF